MTAEYIETVHGRTEVELPQLEMVRDNLCGVPDINLPEGYAIRGFLKGDESAWAEIMTEAFNPCWNVNRFNMFIRPHYAFRPERLLFLCRDSEPIGSAMAFQWPGLSRHTGFIYMLAIRKAYCGKGMGKALTAACIRRFGEEGTFRQVALHTESFRLPAIKHYLDMGFKPRLLVERHRSDWRKVFFRLGRPDLVEKMGIEKAAVLPQWRLLVRTAMVMSYTYWLSIRPALRS